MNSNFKQKGEILMSDETDLRLVETGYEDEFEKIKVFCDESYDDFIKEMDELRIDYFMGPLEKVNIDGDDVYIQTIYIRIDFEFELSFVKKIEKERSNIYQFSRMKKINDYCLVFPDAEMNGSEVTLTYTNLDIIAVFDSLDCAKETYYAVKKENNNEVNVAIMLHILDAELGENYSAIVCTEVEMFSLAGRDD